MGGLAWHGMVWLGARARCFHNEVRCYLPTQYLKIEFVTFCQVIAAPPSGFREGIRRQFRRGMFHIFAKKVHFGTPHLLDFQFAAWWLAGLYACFRKVAPVALPVEVFALVHCHHTPTLPLHPPPPPPRALARLVLSSQGMGGLAWHGMVWLGARARCFHNEVRCYLPTQYLKIEFLTFCQVIAAPPSGFREGIRRQFRRGMFHIFAKKVHFGTPHLLDFQVAAWWLAGLYACFRKVAPLALPVEVFALVHCHHTPTLPLHPPPSPRARSLASSRQAKAWLAWLGMVWYGLVREPGAFIMKCGATCRHNISKLNS